MFHIMATVEDNVIFKLSIALIYYLVANFSLINSAFANVQWLHGCCNTVIVLTVSTHPLQTSYPINKANNHITAPEYLNMVHQSLSLQEGSSVHHYRHSTKRRH
jgi:hypothetical protein